MNIGQCQDQSTREEKVCKFTKGSPISHRNNPFRKSDVVLSHRPIKNPTVKTERNFCDENVLTQHLKVQENKTNNFKETKSFDSSQIDDYVTTEEVLNQSKFVKTYIKNPDAYFTYDPSVLARLKLEDFQKISDKRLKWKPIYKQPSEKDQTQKKNSYHKNMFTLKNSTKCVPLNNPDLDNLKIHNGAGPNSSNIAHLNPAEVKNNARRFDERVKKLQIRSDDDLNDFDSTLNETCDELDIYPKFYMQIQPRSIQLCTNSLPLSMPYTFSKKMSSFELKCFRERKSFSHSPKEDDVTLSTIASSNQPYKDKSVNKQSSEKNFMRR
nr:uncharacterized protein LOC108133614 isoform X2 [Drosophila bipectinata]